MPTNDERPFLTEKQKEFIKEGHHRFNIKTGATRSGKTYLDILYTIPSRIRERSGLPGLYLILGVTNSTIERNVLTPLRELYGEENVGTINNKNMCRIFNEKVYCLGAGKGASVSRIRGASIKYCYCDELAEYNPEIFELLKSRLDKPYSIMDATLNPESTNHWLKKEFLDKVEEKGLDVYEQKYTIFDNTFLTKEFVENLCKEYEGTVYYNRYILGEWCNAEGLIYLQFVNNQEQFIRNSAVDENDKPINFMIISIGIDYGATKGETEFKATGITFGFKQVWTIDEMKLTGLTSPEKMYEKFVEFYNRVVHDYGKVTHCFADYGALGQVLTYGLNRYLQQHSIPLQVNDCIKGRILERIELDCHLFATDRRRILRKCKYLIEAYQQALWDEEHEDTRLDDGTTPIDDLDASEYSIFPFYDKLMMRIGE